jgi:hypothetical protein
MYALHSSAFVLDHRDLRSTALLGTADKSLMHECARAHRPCDRAHTSDLAMNFSFIKFVNPSFRPINT